MKNFGKIFASLAVTAFSACSCIEKIPEYSEPSESSHDEIPVVADTIEENAPFDISGQTVTWLADYDLNLSGDAERSVAVSIFEDVYGAKINFVRTTADNKYNRLAEMIAGGEEVDMFPYEAGAFPEGVLKNQYQPLDDYFDLMGFDEGLWDDMSGVIDMFEYSGQHYVIPYELSNPVVITYSRKLMEQEGLQDPCELYSKGEWNWDIMMEMMEKFVENSDGTVTRYGISGEIGSAVLQSTGKSVVNYEDGRFVNNIKSHEIEKAGLFMQEIAGKNLVYNNYIGHFPKDNSTLFFSMGDWALGESNALNPESDLMVVPFPKSPDADRNYIGCKFNARMLVQGSDKGEAVATYIKCERIASTQEEYKTARKKQALLDKKTASGTVEYFVTEEQYNALQTYLDTANTVPVFDFAYGMGEKMNGNGDYTYKTKGVMTNMADAVLNGTVESWEKFRDEWTGVIDETVKEFNK